MNVKYTKYVVGFTLLVISFIYVGLLVFESANEDRSSSTAITPAGVEVSASSTSLTSSDDAVVAQGSDVTVASPVQTKDLNAALHTGGSQNALALARQRWNHAFTVGEQLKGSDNYRRSTFYAAEDFKYPLVRFDETFSGDPDANPDAELLSQVAYVADHILVRYEPEQRGLIDGVLARFPELSIRHELPSGNHVLIQFPLPDNEIDYFSFWEGRLKSRGLYAEKDRLTFHTAVPADPDYGSQWALNNTGQTGGTDDADIDAQEAWDIQQGSKDVIVAVIDTGVDLEHVDLQANLWSVSTGFTIIQGANIVAGGNRPDDIDGHGTHVAGVIGAKSNNSRAIAGLNWDVSIMPVKVLDDFGVGTISDVIEGVSFATAYGASIINMSLGASGGGANTEEDALYVKLREARDMGDEGVLVVASAGNDGLNMDEELQFPAGYNLANIISVASTDHNDDISGFSNFGFVGVDLAAPGSAILSTLPDNATGELSGTSMAAPHVTGVAALIKAQDPSLNYLEIRNLILNTVDQLPSLKGKVATGGRLNANNALLSFTGSNALITALNLRPAGGPGNNGDAFLTVGESMLVDVAIGNFGSAAATNVSVVMEIVQGDTFATLVGPATLALADIPAGDTILLESAFELTAEALGAFDFKQDVEIKVTLNFDSKAHFKFTTYEIFQAATLSGQVFEGADGVTPIPGALVEVSAQSAAGTFRWSEHTAADGSFTFNLFTGLVAVRVSADGYTDSVPEIIDLTPANPNVVKNYELGASSFKVLTPDVSVTLPAGGETTVNAKIQNTGTSPSPLFVTVEFSEGGEQIVRNRLYGLTGLGTTNPNILILDDFTFTVTESININLPAGKFAHDFTYVDGEMWILTHNSDGSASVFGYNAVDWSPVASRDLDLRNTDQLKSVEAIMSVSLPSPTENDPEATDEVLAVLMSHRYFLERIYQINPYAERVQDISTYIGQLPTILGSSLFFFGFDTYRLQGTNARSRGTFFASESNYLYEFSLSGEGGAGGEEGTDQARYSISLVSEKWLGSFREFDFFDFDFGFNYNFPLSTIRSITYFDTNQGLYVFTNAPNQNVLRLNFDEEEAIQIFDKPEGLDRLASSSTGISLDWLSVGYASGSVARGKVADLPLKLNAAELVDTNTRIATIQVRAPLLGEEQIIRVNLIVGGLSQDPGFVKWYQQFYLQDPDANAAKSDTDGDGIEASIEYVVGGNPIKNDNANGGLPSIVRDPTNPANDIFLKFRRRIDLPEGAMVIKGSDSLAVPMVELVEGVNYEVISVTPIDNVVEEVIISTPFQGSFFYELEINL